MANDLFRVALAVRAVESSLPQLAPVFDYVERYWHLTQDDLARRPFDIEEALTLLETQFSEAENDPGKQHDIVLVYSQLLWLLRAVLEEFSLDAFGDLRGSMEMLIFGEHVISQNATTISFNYDTILERTIEMASGMKESPSRRWSIEERMADPSRVPPEYLAYSHHNWNRALGYGVKFDRLKLQQAGVSTYVDRNQFYSHPDNELHRTRILKVHGSLNWYRYTGLPAHPPMDERFPEDRKDWVLLVDEYRATMRPPPQTFPEDLEGWQIEPIVVPPSLDKVRPRALLGEVWKQAREALSRCSCLVIIGYSFPPTDFDVKKLFRESFADAQPEELVVVNPDTSVVQIAKDLAHFEGAVQVCSNLSEYLRSIGIRFRQERGDEASYTLVEGLSEEPWRILKRTENLRQMDILRQWRPEDL